MIRVNLLKNMGISPAIATTGTPAATGIGVEAVAGDVNKVAAIRFVVILILPLAIYAYESIGLSTLNTQLAGLNEKVVQLEAEKQGFGDLSPKVTAYAEARKKAEGELDKVVRLAAARLREVKALDAIQGLVPNRTWLRNIKIEGNKVEISGYTMTDEGVSELIRVLESSAFFSGVEPKGTSQETLPTGPVKKFEIHFRIGKQG